MNYFNTWSGFECHSSEGKPGALGAEGLSVPQYYEDRTALECYGLFSFMSGRTTLSTQVVCCFKN